MYVSLSRTLVSSPSLGDDNFLAIRILALDETGELETTESSSTSPAVEGEGGEEAEEVEEAEEGELWDPTTSQPEPGTGFRNKSCKSCTLKIC